MQRSLVEVGRIDVGLTYRYIFVYIRQLAIHLRNAITVKKKVMTVVSVMVIGMTSLLYSSGQYRYSVHQQITSSPKEICYFFKKYLKLSFLITSYVIICM